MSKAKTLLISILVLVTLILIGWNLADHSNDGKTDNLNSDQPDYQSKFTDTLLYDPAGKLQYQLIAYNVEHYASEKESWFEQPVLTLFSQEVVEIWTISADKAKLTNKQMLYLYGNVKIRSLDPSSQLQTVDTSSATINLTTQDITSEEQVMLIGQGFRSNGLKMRGNLRNKHAQLIEKVKTTYETQARPPLP